MAKTIHRPQAPRPKRRQKKQRAKSQEAQVQNNGYVLNRADFEGMSDDAFAFLQMIDASPDFQSVLADLATK